MPRKSGHHDARPQESDAYVVDARAYAAGLGRALRRRREQLGLSQTAVALELGDGATQSRVWEWESGDKLIRIDTLLRVCAALRISIVAVMAAAETHARDVVAGRGALRGQV